MKINIYCDESCHLEHHKITKDNSYMVIGGISCPNDKKKEVFDRIKSIKLDNGISIKSEMKWTKVTTGRLAAYKALINYFFDVSDLSFRCVSIDKRQLRHDDYNHTHDDFYYKIYWLMLDWFIETKENKYNIYLDKKDSLGSEKIANLHSYLSNAKYDFNKNIISKIQEINSHDVVLMQIVDILIGSISYANRYSNEGREGAKSEIVRLVQKRTGLSLLGTTPSGVKKFNILQWEGR